MPFNFFSQDTSIGYKDIVRKILTYNIHKEGSPPTVKRSVSCSRRKRNATTSIYTTQGAYEYINIVDLTI
jgi:hypothetical protein